VQTETSVISLSSFRN